MGESNAIRSTYATPLSPKAAGYILRADGIKIDGVLDAAYLESASLASADADVDPREGIAMTRIYRGGAPLGAGDLLYFCIELLDLTYLPDGYDDALPSEPKYKDDWSYSPQGAWKSFENDLLPYIYSVGNRTTAYLSSEGGGPAVLQLSARYAAN